MLRGYYFRGKTMFERRKDLDEKINLIIEAYKCGLSVKQTAFLFKASEKAVYTRLLEHGACRPMGTKPKFVDVERLRKLGFSNFKIEQALKL